MYSATEKRRKVKPQVCIYLTVTPSVQVRTYLLDVRATESTIRVPFAAPLLERAFAGTRIAAARALLPPKHSLPAIDLQAAR